jgi:hypothetical protein
VSDEEIVKVFNDLYKRLPEHLKSTIETNNKKSADLNMEFAAITGNSE